MENLESKKGQTIFTCPECKEEFKIMTLLNNETMEIEIHLFKNEEKIGTRTYPVEQYKKTSGSFIF